MDAAINADSLSIGDGTLVVSFCKVTSGLEQCAFSAIAQDHPDGLLFKVLGDYDIVKISENRFHSSRDMAVVSPAVSSCQGVSAVKLSLGRQYVSPDPESWLSGAPFAALVFLELDKWLYTLDSPMSLVADFITHVYSDETWHPNEVAFYGGLGQSELVCLVRPGEAGRLFDFIQFVRQVRVDKLSSLDDEIDSGNLTVLSSTFSIPLISYREVVIPRAYDRLSGRVCAEIKISCPPGFEGKICATEYFRDSLRFSSLGHSDISVIYPDGVPLSHLIRDLLSFRTAHHDPCPLPFDTSTSILFPTFASSEPDYYKIENDPYPALSQEAPHFEESCPYLANRIKSITHRIASFRASRSTYPSVMRLSRIPERLFGEARNYIEAEESGEPVHLFEGTILSILDRTEVGLIQRTESALTHTNSAHYMPSQYGDGVLVPLVAVEFFVDFIFEQLAEHVQEDVFDWKGFVFFSDTLGFQYHPENIFSLPVEAVSSVISKRMNWLTLTHEISHAVFAALHIDECESEALGEMVKRLSSRDDVDLEEGEFARIRDSFFELFAHWFDYCHFFDSELTFYLECIWESWFAVPFVHKEPNEYIFRSFAIFVISDCGIFEEAVAEGSERLFLESRWAEFTAFVSLELPEIYDQLDFSIAKSNALILAESLLPPFAFVARKYRYRGFQKSINAFYPALHGHLADLTRGQLPATQIQNPFLVVKECRRSATSWNSAKIFRASASILLAFRNEVFFLDSGKND